ncbi:DNA cytosine methyltransferase [Mesorhizobium sp. BR-1-1-8]|uniref:DNA cytosine methyltransferase n=1 Tax=Mesorhizobium sp. BR-1-1-8 TaxID=2876659 RepID=UPI001CCA2CFC|nr:DNA cytosine methyltransferase [Mesorhizobium sp. BR-1-1-8]MBZ9983993.1 DNA cytosine methyltransferase [Mesorhizobium sp. BR-1-1-8]
MTLRAVDLFCGVGGFAHGMQKAGIKIIRSMDYDPAVIDVHRRNIKDVTPKALRQIPPPIPAPQPAADGRFRRGQIHKSRAVSHVADLTAVIQVAPEITLDKPDVIFGGPPCQAFSSAGAGEGDNDARSMLSEAFAIIIAAARPKYFVMENVKGLRKSETFKRAVAVFRQAGYGLSETIVNASHFGTPQARERLILAGCLGETDGWFRAYINQYKSAARLTVADVLGADFGTPYADFVLDPACPDAVAADAREPYEGYELRERDLKRLAEDDVGPDTRFYFCTPGGAASAAVHRTDRPAPTLIRTSMHLLAGTYRPLAGDPVDLRKLWQPSFDQYSRLAGYPEGWDWGLLRSEVTDDTSDDELILGGRQRQLMLANSVPPPLAYAIGRALVDHHARKIPVQPVEAKAIDDAVWHITERDLKRYRKWLRVGKGLAERALRQEISDLRNVKRLVANRMLRTAADELQAFDSLPAAAGHLMSAARKAQLRRTLANLAEFEFYQSYVRIGLFPDDDEAFRRGELHHMIDPAREHVLDDFETTTTISSLSKTEPAE